MASSIIYDLYTTFVKDNWKLYILYLITLISLPLQNIAMPHFYGEVINSLKDKNIDRSKYYFGVLLGVWVLIQAFSIGISFVDNYISPKFHGYIRQFFFDLIVDRYNQNYQELEIGNILTKLIKLPWILDDISNLVQRFLLTNSILIVSNFVYLFRNHYSLGLIYLGCVGVVFIMARLYFNTCNSNIKKVENNYDNCHEEIEDTLQNLLSIYTSKKIPDEKTRIEDINNITRSEQYNAGLCNRKFRIYFSITNVFLFLALNYVAYRLYSNGLIKVENLVSIFILNYTILGSLVGLYDSAKDFMNVKSHVELIDTFIKELPETDTSKQTKTIPHPETGLDIRFKDIVYTPGHAKEPLFNKLNLRIYPKQKVALIGHTGCGKTTLAKCIVSLQSINAGEIYINEVPMSEIQINDLRKNVIYIPQHPKLFNRTLRENLTYGMPKDITAEKILDFMKKHGFDELEAIFRKRIDLKVGKNGGNFSGGQKNMVFFLRAAMQNAPLIIADEPASALDPESTQQIKKMIDIIGRDKGIILITHDMELTDNMDRIIKFEKGKVISDVSNKRNGSKY